MLSTRKVIVTGAASGIGKEITLQCLREGASVIACDLNEERLRELARTADSPNLFTYRVNVSHYEEVASLFAALDEEHSSIDGLVNNAGIYLGKSILDYKQEEIDSVLDVNVKGAVYFSQFFGKRRLEQRKQGVIVNMSSVSGQEGSSDAVYGLSKAAILGLTKSCAMNFAPYVRVNAVAPTMVDTAMMERIPEWRKREYVSHQLVNQPLTAEDVAHTVIFLLSDKARHYTGATFDINSGCYLR
ncbi:SDR family oxidoreductase [Paenibacillus oralis]|uniref:SDR family oxidoreductase n=1 Tax=Paenibacillus oralis TaxID=2490856 RepID=A0A3P3U9U8_9BACL|nr:SDR family oxidoreductase [Paenibacillus oralis]RRJ65233.1 SDR family oxidoreductase [Paenibacillus oralis]